jgi:hypothetical protein
MSTRVGTIYNQSQEYCIKKYANSFRNRITYRDPWCYSESVWSLASNQDGHSPLAVTQDVPESSSDE